MRKLVYAFAITAVGGLTSFAASTSAAPITTGLVSSGAAPMVDDFVQKVHRWRGRWHCSERFGWYRGHKVWHEHCHRRHYYPGPFLHFYLYDDDDWDDDWRWRKKRRRHKDWDDDHRHHKDDDDD